MGRGNLCNPYHLNMPVHNIPVLDLSLVCLPLSKNSLPNDIFRIAPPINYKGGHCFHLPNM